MARVPANRSHMVLIHWKPLNGLIDADYGELNTYHLSYLKSFKWIIATSLLNGKSLYVY